ncbi:unnamed protein product [Soboliphyme baturini]|uniref:Secreted protein n=1 Tax=Soboliphyme baturini TaxID=241478 RepID=A0A183ISL3_9BILA|nr:unnamed protein product [Soboliphyme baturini]
MRVRSDCAVTVSHLVAFLRSSFVLLERPDDVANNEYKMRCTRRIAVYIENMLCTPLGEWDHGSKPHNTRGQPPNITA